MYKEKACKISKGMLLLGLLCSIGFTLPSYAQQGIVSGGGDGSSAGGNISVSIGQTFYTATTNASHGVQQPYEIFVVSSIESAQHISLSVKVFPNPTTHYLFLALNPSDSKNNLPTEYMLFDIGGRLLAMGSIVSNETRIQMGSYASGTYILKVVSNRKEVKTFKIIKQ